MRVGAAQWVTTGVGNFNPTSPSLTLTTETYCAKLAGKVREVRADVPFDAPAFATASPTATCPKGTRLLSGGFASPALAAPDVSMGSYPILTRSAGANNSWSVSATRTNTAASAGTETAFAYCLKPKRAKKKGQKATVAKKKKSLPSPRALLVLTQAAVVPATFIGTATATTAPCPGSRRAVSAGFETGPVTPDGGASINQMSLSSGALQLTGLQLFGGPGIDAEPRTITAREDCA